MLYGEALFHAGVGVLCGAGILAVLSAVVFAITGKRLRKQLDAEYGKKRHG
ncbi:MAG: hypothetical protein IJT94_17485 [Oscillibacter sp.]|nr:hypothetical protein [Oscillibacter sp.]